MSSDQLIETIEHARSNEAVSSIIHMQQRKKQKLEENI